MPKIENHTHQPAVIQTQRPPVVHANVPKKENFVGPAVKVTLSKEAQAVIAKKDHKA